MQAQLVTHLLDQYPIQGIDLSKWNERPGNNFILDPKVLLRGGYRFAAVKVSQGVAKDPLFDQFWKILKETFIEAGGVRLYIDRFGYHFISYSKAQYDSSAKGGDTRWGITQARFMWNILKFDPGEIPPYIDLESNAAWFYVNFINCRTVMNIAYACLNELAQLAGYLPGCYSNQGMYPFFGSAMKDYEQWVSWYNDKLVTRAKLDALIKKYKFTRGWRFWQHASDGDVDGNGTPDGLSMGVDSQLLDLNVFNGSEAEYSEYCGRTPAVVHPTPEDATSEHQEVINTKVTLARLNVRTTPEAGGGNIILRTLPVGARVACLEKITRPGEIWWRIGDGEYCAELYNGHVFLK